jgi:alkylhydroperoxidase family enzyme
VKALGNAALVEATLKDWRSAPLDDRVRATVGFLEKLVLTPGEVSGADLAPLRQAGLTDGAIAEAIYVAFVFGVMARLANTFDFRINDARGLRWACRILLGPGYRAGSIAG